MLEPLFTNNFRASKVKTIKNKLAKGLRKNKMSDTLNFYFNKIKLIGDICKLS